MRCPTLEDWLNSDKVEPGDKMELQNLRDPREEQDRFYQFLKFGTGGLRGKMGAGNNRMNLYTVGRATQGLAAYLLDSHASPSVCVAYDTRNHSADFARRAACVLCANGIRVYLYEAPHPTPMLSWAVRCKGAGAGIVLTASHNSKEYNGYKVYGADGGQITDQTAKDILRRIDKCDLFTGTRTMAYGEAVASGLLSLMGEEVDAPYYARVCGLSLRRGLLVKQAGSLKILYSPLHGTGNVPVRRVLKALGFTNVWVVPQQEKPDGDFPTAPSPNPELPSVFNLAVQMAASLQPDLIFATDPDCDRIGVLAQDSSGDFRVLTGNQTGALLCDYLIQTKRELGCLPRNAAVVKTIVTTDLAKRICEQNGVALTEVLTGFKYIGEMIGKWEINQEHSFLLGLEESYGYLAGDFVRDKDAVIAAALIAEMALWYKSQGTTLSQALESLYEKYGYFAEKQISIKTEGKEGRERMAALLASLRHNFSERLAGRKPVCVEDYLRSTRLDCTTGKETALGLPPSNVLKFYFKDKGWFAVRPSGTEPKMKVYLSVCANSARESQESLMGLESFARNVLQ